MFALQLLNQSAIKRPLLNWAARPKKQTVVDEKPIIQFKKLDDVLALTGIRVERKGRKSVFVRTQTKGFFTDKQKALAFCKRQLLAARDYLNSQISQTKGALEELNALRAQMGPNQKFFPNGTTKSWQSRINRIRPNSPIPVRDKTDALINATKKEQGVAKQKLGIIEAGLGYSKLKNLALRDEESYVPCGKTIEIIYPQITDVN